MRRFRSRQLIVLAVVALSTWTCSSKATTPTTPTTPTKTPATITEVYSSPLTPNGAVTFTFTATASGQVTVSLTAISPDSTLALGIALGVLSGATCELQFTNDTAPLGAVVSANATTASSFCARVYDAAGVITAPTSVSVTVTHF
jgi:hypothetical protein